MITIYSYGYQPQSKLWFFGDVAYSPTGEEIWPDSNNAFWHEGIGYQIDDTDFVHGMPLLLRPQTPATAQTFHIFASFCQDLLSTVGNYDAWMLMGMTASYAAAPELVQAAGHPGIWIFGRMTSGKTTLARWLMSVWGFEKPNGVRIGDSTTPSAMTRILGQYNSLPVFFDEYQSAHMNSPREDVLRGCFERSTTARGIGKFRTRQATILTSPIVCGEDISPDAATRSRFAHVLLDSDKRIGDSAELYTRIQEQSQRLYHIGNFLMANRPSFATRVSGSLLAWMHDQDVMNAIPNERVRWSLGVAYCCFEVLAGMLEWRLPPSILKDYRNHLFGKH